MKNSKAILSVLLLFSLTACDMDVTINNGLDGGPEDTDSDTVDTSTEIVDTDTGVQGNGFVVPAMARACQAVIDDPEGSIESVHFSDRVRGEWLRHGDHIAFAFHAVVNAPIPIWDVSLVITGELSDGILFDENRCFYSSGAPIETAALELSIEHSNE